MLFYILMFKLIFQDIKKMSLPLYTPGHRGQKNKNTPPPPPLTSMSKTHSTSSCSCGSSSSGTTKQNKTVVRKKERKGKTRKDEKTLSNMLL